MESTSETSNRIELRSEKVRHIIGIIPPAITRWGIAILVLNLIVLLIVMFFIPYPYGEGESIIRHLVQNR